MGWYRCEICSCSLEIYDKRKGLSMETGKRPEDSFDKTYQTDLYKCTNCGHIEAI